MHYFTSLIFLVLVYENNIENIIVINSIIYKLIYFFHFIFLLLNFLFIYKIIKLSLIQYIFIIIIAVFQTIVN